MADTPATLPYGWNADHPARVGLLPRDGSTAADATVGEAAFAPALADAAEDDGYVMASVHHPDR
jgi:carotenoid cleavage dioxygenase-like enzyme